MSDKKNKTQESIKDDVVKDDVVKDDVVKDDVIKKEKRTSDKKVEVDKKILENLIEGYEKQAQQIKDLEEASDLGRLDRIKKARSDGKLVKKAKVSIYDNKVVLGWKKSSDEVYFDEQGKLHEDQTIILILDEGKGTTSESKTMSYRAFTRNTIKIDGEVIRDSKDKDGGTFYTIKLEDGREFELSIMFIN